MADGEVKATTTAGRAVRADAQRNLDAVLAAAKSVFAVSGVDAPVREIAAAAGVGVGTVYRHFPQRSDLIAAVFRKEIDACVEAAVAAPGGREPFAALAYWIGSYAAFVAAKRGLAPALHSGDPAFLPLRADFEDRLRPAFHALFDAAAAAGQIRAGVQADDLLGAVSALCLPAQDQGRAARMVALLLDGLKAPPAEDQRAGARNS